MPDVLGLPVPDRPGLVTPDGNLAPDLRRFLLALGEVATNLSELDGDHGVIGGLGDDDHPQYHNDARGDARYYTRALVDAALSGKEDSLGVPASDGDVLSSTVAGVRSWVTPGGGGGAEVNDLTAAVTWANIPDANVPQSAVTQHQAALSITESQISDLGPYLTSETSHADVLVDADIGVNVQAHNAVLDATTASFTTAEETKLAGIETGADVTDAVNVAAAGALMNKADVESVLTGEITSHTHPGGGGGITEYMYPIWAEENSTLGNSAYEWAFGNGANTPSNNGIAIYVPTGWQAHIVAMSATTNNASGSSVIEANINGVLQGANCNVTLAGRSATNDSFTPVALSNADRLTFRTTTAGTNSSPNTVCAWIRMTAV